MASEWRVYKVDQIKADVPNAIAIGPFGSRMKADLYVEEGVPVIRGNNLGHGKYFIGDFVYVSDQTADDLKTCNVFPSDLVFPHRGAIGEVGIVPLDGFPRYMLSTSLMKLTCDPGIAIPLFVYYFFKSRNGRRELLKRASTVGTPGIGQPLTSLRQIEIKLPSLDEQYAITSILSAIDDAIETKRSQNDTLEAITQAIFKSWFVDFDPVKAKAEGREPDGMDAATAALFPSEFEDSELGPIPQGWSVKSIYELADVIYGAPFKSSLFNGEGNGFPLIRIRDLAYHSPEVFTTEKHPKGYLVQPGDLIVGMDGEFRAHLWKGPEAWMNQRVCCFIPKGCIARSFLRYSIQPLLEFVERSEAATTVIHLGKSDIDRFRTIVPTREIVAKYSETTIPIESKIIGQAQQATTLGLLRDTLLPKLMSGQIRVSTPNEVEAELESEAMHAAC